MRTFKQVLPRYLLALLATLWISQAPAAELLDQVVAIVNDDIVLQSELDSRTELVSEQIQAQGTPLPDEPVLREQVLERLIMDRIQLQIADRQGIRVSEQELNTALQNIADKNNMTLAQFREALIAEGRDYAQAREQIRQEMLLARVQQANVNRRISVSRQEIDNYLNSESSQDTSEFLLSNLLVAIPQDASPETIQRARRKPTLSTASCSRVPPLTNWRSPTPMPPTPSVAATWGGAPSTNCRKRSPPPSAPCNRGRSACRYGHRPASISSS